MGAYKADVTDIISDEYIEIYKPWIGKPYKRVMTGYFEYKKREYITYTSNSWLIIEPTK
jgi:hypothetical protein